MPTLQEVDNDHKGPTLFKIENDAKASAGIKTLDTQLNDLKDGRKLGETQKNVGFRSNLTSQKLLLEMGLLLNPTSKVNTKQLYKICRNFHVFFVEMNIITCIIFIKQTWHILG